MGSGEESSTPQEDFHPQKASSSLSLCGCQVNLGLKLECGLGLKVHMFCLASSVSQLGLTLLWLQGLTCDPDSANQRTPPLWNGEGPLNLGQSEPSLELLGTRLPIPWIQLCLKPAARMEAALTQASTCPQLPLLSTLAILSWNCFLQLREP